jgi:hypothetical protein
MKHIKKVSCERPAVAQGDLQTFLTGLLTNIYDKSESLVFFIGEGLTVGLDILDNLIALVFFRTGGQFF